MPINSRYSYSLAAILALLTLFLMGCAGNSEPASRTFNLSIDNRSIGDEHKKLRLTQDDEITLHITTDEEGTFHIHGYDLKSVIKTGQSSEIRFKANATRKFDFEMHFGTQGHKQDEHDHNHDHDKTDKNKDTTHETENADVILGSIEVFPK